MNDNSLSGGGDIALGGVMLVFMILAAILAVFWILFPILVWQHLRDLNKTVESQLRELRIITTLLTPHTKSELAPPPAPVPVVPASCRCESCAAEVEYQPSQSGTACPCPNCGNEINLP